MELYELLVKRQLEGKNVDWAFRPARSMGGEAGLTKILDGITGECSMNRANRARELRTGATADRYADLLVRKCSV